MNDGCAGALWPRFVAFGRGAAQAWTQPFFREKPMDEWRTSPFVADWQASRLLSVALPEIRPGRLPGADMGWSSVRASVMPEGFINVARLHGRTGGVCLLKARVEVDRAGEWIASLGHDGGASLFVDGKRVIHRPARVNPAYPDRSRARVRLARGKHDLLVALDTDNGLGQGIFLRFLVPPGITRDKRPAFPRPTAP